MTVYVASGAGPSIINAADNVDDLKTLGGQYPDGAMVFIKGHTTSGDGGGGWFRLDRSGTLGAAAQDNGTIIETSAGTDWYWRRELDTPRIITPLMFGIVDDFDGTTGTDNGPAVQAAADACDALNASTRVFPTLAFPKSNGYYCEQTITIKESIHVQMDAPIVHNVSDSSVGLIVGTSGTGNTKVKLKLRVTRRLGDTSDWTNEGSVGAQIFGLRSSDLILHIGEFAGGFTIGAQLYGHTVGFSWNTVRFGQIRNNKFGIDMTNAGTGFCNENLLLGGEFVVDTGLRAGITRYCVRMTSTDQVNTSLNNNLFLKPSCECRTECIPFLIEHGQKNEVIGARDEGNSGVFAVIEHFGARANFANKFNLGRGEGTLTQKGNAYDNAISYRTETIAYSPLRLVFDSGNVGDNAIAYNSSNTFVRNMQVGASTVSAGLISVSSIPFSYAEEFTTDFATNNDTLLDTAHPLADGDRVYLTTSASDLPNGLLEVDGSGDPQLYYVVQSETDAFKLSLTRGGSPVTFSDDGSGTHTYNARRGHVQLTTARSVTKHVDTTVAKNFLLERDTAAGFPGRVMVSCFDAEGVLLENEDTFTVDTATDEIIPDNTHTPVAVGDIITLTNSGGALPSPLATGTDYYVLALNGARFTVSLTEGGSVVDITTAGTGTHTYAMTYQYASHDSFSWTTSFQGHYRNGTDTSLDFPFRVRDEVKSINVGVSGGTDFCKLRRFKVWTTDTQSAPRTWVDYELEPDRFLATQAPTFGVYYGGLEISNAAAVAGEASGWILPTGGAPGTWQSKGELPLHDSGSWDPPNLVDGAGASNAFTVTGAAVGDFVQVAPPYDLQEILMSASVTAADTVEVRLQNETGGAINLASGSWSFLVTKPPT